MMSNKPIYISTPKLKITAINKSTKARGFRQLKIGDTVQFRSALEHIGRNRGLYATYFRMFINDEQTEFEFSQNEFVRYLDYFELGAIS